MNEQRLIELEIKVAHHENTIDSLQQVIYEQHKAIEKLELKFEQLSQRLQQIGDTGLEIGPANEKPPHY